MKLSVLFSLCLFLRPSEEKCKYFEQDNLRFLGTKTPYRFVANLDDNEVAYPGCHPSKMFGIMRHGTRNPAEKHIIQIQETLAKIKSDILDNSNKNFKNDIMCDNDRNLFMGWKFESDAVGQKFLTKEGREEMFSIAKRIQKRFPSLLPTIFKNESFLFRFTQTQRTEESAKHFTSGLFGSSSKVWFPHPVHPDPILRFYKLCEKWRKEVKKSPSAKKARREFIKREEVHQTLRNISNRFGLNYTLSFDSARLMYLACSFETAWNSNKISPWCLIFRNYEIKVFEYADELKYYWIDGYGYEINHRQACPLFQNVMLSLLGESDNYKSVFYFTHSGTLLKALSRLGLYKDSFTIDANVPLEAREKRLWRVSYIDSFSSNIIFVLFKCDGEEDKVLVTHQERQVKLKGCPDPPQLCPMSTLRDLLNSDISCNFTEICSL